MMIDQCERECCASMVQPFDADAISAQNRPRKPELLQKIVFRTDPPVIRLPCRTSKELLDADLRVAEGVVSQ